MDDQTQPQPPQQPVPPAAPTPVPPATPTPAQPAQPTSPYAPPASPYAQPTAPVPGSGYYGQPQQPGRQPMPQPAGYYQPVAPQSSGKIIAALVCGILAILFSASVLFGIVLGIVAIVLAVQGVKQTGKDGKATGAKACGIIGIVLSVLAFFLYMILGLGALAYVATYDDYDSLDVPNSLDSSSDMPPITEGDQQMKDAVSAQLDLLKGHDAATVQRIAADADEAFAYATDYGLTDLGIDPVSFTEWMLSDFDYQLDGVYDNGDGTGTAYADVTLRDVGEFANAFIDSAQASVDSGEMKRLDESGVRALLGTLCHDAMDKTTGTTTDYVGLDLVKNGDSWQVDEDSWEDEVDYLFGL